MICPNCTYVPPNSQAVRGDKQFLSYAHCPLCGTELTSRMDMHANVRAQIRNSTLSNASLGNISPAPSSDYQRNSIAGVGRLPNPAAAEMQAELAGLRAKHEEHERLVQRLRNEN